MTTVRNGIAQLQHGRFVRSPPSNTGCAYQEILPVLPGEAGMEPHHSDCGACECLYLPDKKFVHCGESWVFAWYPVNDGSNSGTLE
ncbi:hypothetical protein ACTE22_002790 [Escherichia coli]